MRFKPTTLSLLLAILLWHCKNKPQQTAPVETANAPAAAPTEPVPADFAAFYQRFHQDSQFQMAHIAWPLAGETTIQKDSTKTEKKQITWEQKTWRMHHAIDYSTGEFKQTLTPLGDGIVIEVIRYAAANFGLERRFAKNPHGEWELIFYSDMAERQ